MASLESVRQKIGHAKLHLDALNTEIERYMNTHPGEVVPNPDSDPNRPTFLYRQKEAIPARIGLLAGDCLQNLRSAFDYLIWELVLAEGNVPCKANMFPVCATDKAFKDAKRGDRLKGISANAEALVERLQPYTYTVDPSQHWLGILDYLVNINKHRRILLASLSAFSMNRLMAELQVIARGDNPPLPGVIHNVNDRNIFTPEETNMQGDLVAFIAFDEGAVKGMEIGLSAETFMGLVSETVASFDKFFA